MSFLSKCLIVSLCYAPIAHALTTTEAAEFNNGAVINALTTAVTPYVFTNVTPSLLGWSMYYQPISLQGKTEQLSGSAYNDFVTRHTSTFCTKSIPVEANAPGFKCGANPPTGPTANTPPSPGQATDVQLQQLGDLNFADITEPLVYTTFGEATARNLIRTIWSPFPSNKFASYISTSSFLTTPEKEQEYANFLASQATLSVALNSFMQMYANRLPGSIAGVASNPTPTMGQTPQQAQQVATAAQNASILSTMQNEATRRFTAQDFQNLLNQMAPVGSNGVPSFNPNNAAVQPMASPVATPDTYILAEIASMQAFMLWMEYQRFLQMERIEALLAASLSNNVNSNITQQAIVSSAQASVH